ncbi:MAG: Asp-tRNA(Asn)/Glu-tRNA(Gln) amidotransferase subunit GatC [Gammaproteobacteria bacterium]|nr:Asp-tRNA(Asn)/Glu-tRNA(Gln) amidotransferase subunit GatC [Gammaproteobacteria bacterium]
MFAAVIYSPILPRKPLINIQHLARLARLSIDDQAEQSARDHLANIIAMIDSMRSVDTDNVVPMAHPMDATQRLREDKVTENVDRDQFQANAPATAQGYYLVPQVIDSGE